MPYKLLNTRVFEYIRKSPVLKYGLFIGLLLIIFRILESQFFSENLPLELYLLSAGIVFLGLGIFLGMKINTAKQIQQINVVAEESIPTRSNTNGILTSRENEVLALIKKGLTYREISARLFVSINTTKTHIKNIYSKLDVKNKAQAVEKAKKMQILD